MSCNDSKLLIVRAGDAWSPTFRYHLGGVPLPLPDGAELVIRPAKGAPLLSATIGDGLAFESTSVDGGDPVRNIIRLIADADMTAPLAVRNERTELVLALAVFEPGTEDDTRQTIAVADVVALPRLVGG